MNFNHHWNCFQSSLGMCWQPSRPQKTEAPFKPSATQHPARMSHYSADLRCSYVKCAFNLSFYYEALHNLDTSLEFVTDEAVEKLHNAVAQWMENLMVFAVFGFQRADDTFDYNYYRTDTAFDWEGILHDRTITYCRENTDVKLITTEDDDSK
jgi:hypothetical protein